jgi:hypothetical protein
MRKERDWDVGFWWRRRWATRYLRRCCAVLRCLAGIAFAREEMGLCWIPRGRSVKARDVVILLLLHVLYMYMVPITMGDVYNDGVVTGNSSFATSHVRPFHAWMRAKELGGKRQDANRQDRLVLGPCWGSSADGLDHSHMRGG